MKPGHDFARGTISLVALCFITVLGIALSSYLTICSRAMTLSNRSFQAGLSQQLADFGLEEGLRAFNKGDWSGWSSNPSGIAGATTAWTLDTTNKRASRTITFDSTRLGQNVTATVKIRIDNYDVNTLGAAWSSSATYNIGDLVGRSGIWYRCVQDGNTNRNPATQTSLAWWAPAPVPWAWCSNTAYTMDNDVVSSGGLWYRCIASHTSGANFAVGSNWSLIPAPSLSWSSSTTYGVGAFVYNGAWYRCTTSHTNQAPPNASYWTNTGPQIAWRWRSGYNNSFNDVVLFGSVWYRYINSTTANVSPPDTDYWENALSGSMSAWSSSNAYNAGDTVYYGSTGRWYRCIKGYAASGSITPTSTTPPYWANTPAYSTAWDSGKQYAQYDTVSYNGVWYLSLLNSNTNQNPSTATTYWITANTTNSTYRWDATTAYTANTYHTYGGVWYKCTTSTTAGVSPNNTAFWTPTWTNSAGVTTGAPVIYAEASITLPNNPASRTQLRAVIGPAPLFPNAAAAKGTLTVTAATGVVDSYDSTLAAPYGSQGAATNYSAVLAAGTTVAITGNTAVRGYLAWPTPAGGISTGTTVWGASSPGTPNVDSTRISRSPYIPQFDILPSGGLSANWSYVAKGLVLPTAATVNIGTPGAVTPSRYYYSSGPGLRMGGGSSAIQTLNVNGPVIIYINGDLTMTGGPNGIININSTGSVEIHVAGVLKVDSGSDGIKSYTNDPKTLTILCDSASGTTPYYSEGANPFYGTIYMPNTTAGTGLNFNYNDTNATTIYGAVSAANLKFYNNAIVHYDTSLRYTPTPGVDQPYSVTEWRELPIAERATMP